MAGFFVACFLIADVVGIKLFRVPLGFSLPVPWSQTPITAIEHTCGMLTFPLTFILTDLVNEYYGKKGARRLTWIGFGMGAFGFGVINLSLAMPHLDAPWNVNPAAFDAVFGAARVMYVASLCAFLVGQFSDIYLFAFFKRLTKGRLIWLRATGSTLISQLIDSIVVAVLAWNVAPTLFPDDTPPAPLGKALEIGLTGYVLKFVLAIVATPIIYAGHAVLRRRFGLVPVPPEGSGAEGGVRA